jgi:hypothetical protein
MTDKLSLFNAALRELGERKLSSLAENREPRRVLDDVYDQTIKFCLESGAWNFALRTLRIEPDDSLTIDFGYQYGFTKPVDWLRTVGLSTDERLYDPLIQYSDERGYWWADATPLYVRYISNDEAYGMDLTAWPESFTRYVELSLAHRASLGVVGSESTRKRVEGEMRKAMTHAKSRDAMNDPPAFAPTGSWVRARAGGHYRRDDRVR